MIGNGQWVTTRDTANAQLFLDEIRMQDELRAGRRRRRRQLYEMWWARISAIFGRAVTP